MKHEISKENGWTVIHLDPGNTVLCDFCNKDYTTSDESGGILFGSKATCPDCTPRILEGAKKYGEEHYINATCPAEMSFADWVRSLR